VASSKQAQPKPAAAQRRPDVSETNNGVSPIQSWKGDDILVEVQSGNLAGAYRAWRAATARALPRLIDLTTSEARAAIDDMMLMLMKKDDDFVVVAQSRNYIHGIGLDLRGKLHTEMKTPTSEAINSLVQWTMESRQPIYARYVSGFSKQSVYWEMLILPLAADDSGKPAFALNLVSLMDDKSAIMQMVFDRSPVGMIVAAPTRSEKGPVDDGEILSINARAREILRLSESQRRIQTIRQLGPWFRDGTEWVRVGVSAIENGQTRIGYRDHVGKEFEVTIEMFSRFVLFSIVELKTAKAPELAPAE
jgi:PAS domain-containing protein